jgi:hypothetical protein
VNGSWLFKIVVASAVLAPGCGTSDIRFANGIIEGTVLASRPVEGAAVRVWSVDAE